MKIGTIELTITSEEIDAIKQVLIDRCDEIQGEGADELISAVKDSSFDLDGADISRVVLGILIGAELYRRRVEEKEKTNDD
jgi:hypothetical protein